MSKFFLKIFTTLKAHEKVLLFSFPVYFFLQSQTSLSYTSDLVVVFLSYSAILFALVYLSAPFVVLMKLAAIAKESGLEVALQMSSLRHSLLPYMSFAFFFRNLRRCFSIFSVIYLFLHLKHVLLEINPKNYDLFFWNLDRLLHFGIQPNILLAEALSPNYDFSIFLDWLYIKYFFLKYVLMAFFMLELRSINLSEKFFAALCLIWSLGGLAYLIAPADGPCFALLYRYSTRAEDRAHIFQFPVSEEVPKTYYSSYEESKTWTAKGYQQRLWNDRALFLFKNREPSHFYGIAAMPSLHVGVMIVMTYFVFLSSRFLGALGILTTCFVFVGSIFLQWHYAVDGYLGALLAFLSVRLSSLFVGDGD